MSKTHHPKKEYTILEAYYYVNGDPYYIYGIPSYGETTFGKYIARFPYAAASKAFTGIQQHMKKFKEWYEDYDSEQPPQVFFIILDTVTGKTSKYIGNRVPSPRGVERVVNFTDGRVREYRWINKLDKI